MPAKKKFDEILNIPISAKEKKRLLKVVPRSGHPSMSAFVRAVIFSQVLTFEVKKVQGDIYTAAAENGEWL